MKSMGFLKLVTGISLTFQMWMKMNCVLKPIRSLYSYHIGYFAEGEGHVERLRHIDQLNVLFQPLNCNIN